MKKRQAENRDRRPAIIGLVVLLLVAVIFVFAVVRFQFFGNEDQAGVGDKGGEQSARTQEPVGRKHIYDRNYQELAVSFPRSSIYARPLELENPEEVVRQVATLLDADEKNLLSSLKGERSFVWLGRDLSTDKAEQIVNLNLKGVYRIDQVHRYYPIGQVGAHVVGFLKDAQGLAGVESYYDSILRGGGVYDPRLAAAGVSREIVTGERGANLVLTIDSKIQTLLEKKLRGLLGATEAKAGMAALMVPDSGEVVALASLPSYDPNKFWVYGADERRNRVVEDSVPLGGVTALFQTAAALNKKDVLESATIRPATDMSQKPGAATAAWNWLRKGVYVSPEFMQIGRYSVDDATFAEYAEKIGLSGKGEVDLPEVLFAGKEGEFAQALKAGDVEFEERADKGREAVRDKIPLINKATPMAVLTSFSRLLNGGKIMVPHVLREIWQGEQVWQIPVRQGEHDAYVSPDVSRQILAEIDELTAGSKSAFVVETLREAEARSATPERKEAGQEQGVKERLVADTVLLGAYPARQPELALILILEEAQVNMYGEPPERGVAKQFLADAAKMVKKERPRPAADELAIRQAAYYKKWQKLQGESDLQPIMARGSHGLKMPDVRGYSLRKALQVLQEYGLRLQIAGAGQVASQYPLAGASLQGVEQCVLELKRMH